MFVNYNRTKGKIISKECLILHMNKCNGYQLMYVIDVNDSIGKCY